MKYIKTYEFFSFFKKKKKDDNQDFNIDTIQELLMSDFDGVDFRGVDIMSFIKFENCRFKPDYKIFGDARAVEGKPRLTYDKNWFDEEVYYSSTGHYDGVSGILMNYNINAIPDLEHNPLREVMFITRKIFNLINKERMAQFGIGFCINKHHYIGDGIVFYKL